MTLSVIINIPPLVPFSDSAVQLLALCGESGHFLRFPEAGAVGGPQNHLMRRQMSSILAFPYSPLKQAEE